MAQETTTVPTKNTGDELNATELNDINDTLNSNATDSETRLSALESSSGGAVSVAIIEDQKPAGTNGGTFTSGAWRTRDLNTITSDENSIVTLNANQFTLEAGTYDIEGYASAYTVNVHQAGIYNITDSQFNFYGSSQSASSGNAGSNRSIFSGRITISIPKVFEVRHECGTTKTSDGLGRSTSLGAYELYTQLKITKLG